MNWWTQLRIRFFGLTAREQAEKYAELSQLMMRAHQARVDEDYQDELLLCREFGGRYCAIRCGRTPCPNSECPHKEEPEFIK